MAKSAAEILDSSRRAANAFAQSAGKGNLVALLKRAQADLDERMKNVAGDESTFSEVEMRAALSQIAAISSLVKVGLGKQVLANGEAGSRTAVGRSLKYLASAEKQYAGVATPSLGLRTAAVYERAVSGTQTSLLRRLLSDPKDRRSAGILDRYGDAVVAHFEQAMQTRYVAGTPWGDVRQKLTDGSPFLQSAPKYWAERILRTETMYAQNRAGYLAGAEVNAQTGGVMLKILSCVFDDRTGSDSFAVHGQIRRENEPFDTWYGKVMHPPDRPNDRAVVVLHHPEWPIPPELQPKSDAEILARWVLEKRKGAPPPRPRYSTFPVDQIGKPLQAGAETAPTPPAPADPVPTPKPKPTTPLPVPETKPAPTTAADLGLRTLTRAEEGILQGSAASDGSYIGHAAISRVVPTLSDAVAWRVADTTNIRPTDVADVLASVERLADELRAAPKQAGEAKLGYATITGIGSKVTPDDVRASLMQADPKPPVLLRVGPNEYVPIGNPADVVAAQIRALVNGGYDAPIKAHVLTLDEAAAIHFGSSPYLPPKKPDYAAHVSKLGKLKVPGGKLIGAKARDAFRDLVEAHGYGRTRGGASTTIRSYTQEDAKRNRGTLGFASWDGQIAVTGDVAAKGIQAIKALAEGVELTYAQRTALNVYTHETIHVHSPTTSDAYRGHGMVVEEISTELLSRKMIGGLTGTTTERGSYSNIIDPVAEAVGRALGTVGSSTGSIVRGKAALTEAADRLWRRRRVMKSPLEFSEAWLKELEAVGVPTESREAISKAVSEAVQTLINRR